MAGLFYLLQNITDWFIISKPQGDFVLPKLVKFFIILAFFILSLIYICHSLSAVWENPKSNQWDLLIYYSAGQAYTEGLNPYLIEDLAQVSGENIWLLFAYTPGTLEIFKFLPLLEYNTAHRVWLILKLITFAGLIFIWKRYFIKDLSLLLIIPFALFAFDGSAFWDIKAGNISLFEQLIIWSAFLFYLRKRFLYFAILITVISIFKLTPVVFILLLLFVPDQRKWWLAGGSILALVISILANYWYRPELFESFINTLSAIDERAVDYNYGILPFWHDLYDLLKYTATSPHKALYTYISYSCTAMFILYFTIKYLVKAWQNNADLAGLHTVLLSCCAYTLIMPRFKCYSFIIMIPVCLYLLQNARNLKLQPILFLLCLIPIAPPFEGIDVLEKFMRYYPLYISAIIWYLFIAASPGPYYNNPPEAKDELPQLAP